MTKSMKSGLAKSPRNKEINCEADPKAKCQIPQRHI
jgi:hypothetical protein